MIISDFIGIWENDHNQKACDILREYDAQCDYPDGSLKPASSRKPLSFFAEKYGFTMQELKKHWRCLINDNQ